MTQAQEKKLLTTLIKRLDQPGTGILGTRFFLSALWIALVIVFTLMFHLANRELLSPPTLVAIAALIGTFIGWILFYVTALKQWPVIRQHIDRARVENRLRELET
jgi:hypothetical protein